MLSHPVLGLRSGMAPHRTCCGFSSEIFPVRSPAPPALRGTWLGEWPSLCPLIPCVIFICSKLIPLPSANGIHLFLMGALLHHQRCFRTLRTALAQALSAAVWVPGAPGTFPCTAVLVGGSQPGRSCPCPDPAQWLQCCPPARPSGLPLALPPLSACHSVPFLTLFGCWEHHPCLLCAPWCLQLQAGKAQLVPCMT